MNINQCSKCMYNTTLHTSFVSNGEIPYTCQQCNPEYKQATIATLDTAIYKPTASDYEIIVAAS